MVLSLLEMLMGLVNVFDFGFWNKVFGTSSMACRTLGQILLMVQLTQFSQRIEVKTHYGVHGEVTITGINQHTNREIFSVQVNSSSQPQIK